MSARTTTTLRRLARVTAIGLAGALLLASPSPGSATAGNAWAGTDLTAAATGTAYGNVVKPQGTQTFPEALAVSESRYGGHLGVIRYFDGNAPDS